MKTKGRAMKSQAAVNKFVAILLKLNERKIIAIQILDTGIFQFSYSDFGRLQSITITIILTFYKQIMIMSSFMQVRLQLHFY